MNTSPPVYDMLILIGELTDQLRTCNDYLKDAERPVDKHDEWVYNCLISKNQTKVNFGVKQLEKWIEKYKDEKAKETEKLENNLPPMQTSSTDISRAVYPEGSRTN